MRNERFTRTPPQQNHKLRMCDIGHSAASDRALEKASVAGYKDSAPAVPITSRTAHDEFQCPSAMEEQRSSPVFPAPWRRSVPIENPNGIPALSPAVARPACRDGRGAGRHELPWVMVQSKNHQPHRGCDLHLRVRATTPAGLISISDSPPGVAPPSSWQHWDG